MHFASLVRPGPEDPTFEYLAFAGPSGSVSRMAVVRRGLPRALGRYLLGAPIAAGGMATVHLGRLVGPSGFSRTVAIKRMHGELADRPDLVARFTDEARIAGRVRHANVVQMLDVVAVDGEILLVLEYVHGASLARLRKLAARAGETVPLPILAAILAGVLRGLHAAHEATTARGAPLEIVHRDVSPQNVIVGVDGVARVLDFGIARAEGREAETLVKDLKGKLAYMAPEQISGEPVDRRCDLWAAAVMTWETLAGERLFKGDDAVATMEAIFHFTPPPLAHRVDGVTGELDGVLACALAKSAEDRYGSAEEMARAIETAIAPASDKDVARWVSRVAASELAAREALLADFVREERSAPGSETRIVASDKPAFASQTAVMAAPVAANVPSGRFAKDEPATLDAVTIARPVNTPLAMAMPHPDDPISETRYGPVEHLRRASPAPVTFSTSAPLPRRSAAVALVVVPAAIVATAAIVLLAPKHLARTAAAAPPAAEALLPAVVSPPPPPPEAAVPPAPPIVPAATVSATASRADAPPKPPARAKKPRR